MCEKVWTEAVLISLWNFSYCTRWICPPAALITHQWLRKQWEMLPRLTNSIASSGVLCICPAFSGKMAIVLISWPDRDLENIFLLHFLNPSSSLSLFLSEKCAAGGCNSGFEASGTRNPSAPWHCVAPEMWEVCELGDQGPQYNWQTAHSGM